MNEHDKNAADAQFWANRTQQPTTAHVTADGITRFTVAGWPIAGQWTGICAEPVARTRKAA
jgi:hypothetical protein